MTSSQTKECIDPRVRAIYYWLLEGQATLALLHDGEAWRVSREHIKFHEALDMDPEVLAYLLVEDLKFGFEAVCARYKKK